MKEYKFEYILAPSKILSSGTGEPLSVNFYIHWVVLSVDAKGNEVPELEDEPTLSGQVDWQDGIHIWQSESIDPNAFVAVMATAHEAILEARKLIGSRWDFDDLSVEPQ